ncbi:MAG: UDP-N-acetylmuramoyl-tripeptide--D-alanyl-D-alanine ligase [Azoarcus sp.]|jgi:UDP-N-acetylmuramoyl-tripeptide--D-alanyl-D-alanine ligase|nr:UDP-N-acetylmuramoyl-tripeptide--D-alanyl-D-alanine ligase [Azoarcus sp.]
MMTLVEAAGLLAAREARALGDVRFDAVGTDSRAIASGQLFVALRGDRYDGHDFVEAALACGAAAAMVDARWAAEHPRGEAAWLVVDDTRLALGGLAAGWRVRYDIPVIGVTGSNGKTTVKEMIAAVLRVWAGRDDAVLATRGNFNNDIGLPLTLLGLRAGHKAAVIEMGMNHPGEIAYLTGLARPTVALVNNVQRAHLEGLGTLAEVAREKGHIYDGLGDEGIAIVNAEDPHILDLLLALAGHRWFSFGFGIRRQAEVKGRYTLHGLGAKLHIETLDWGEADVDLRVPGVHNVLNALAAATACLVAGVPLATVAAGLGGYDGAHGRLQRRTGPKGALILDDSYNANPDSVRAAIDVLAAMPGQTFLVLGDMGEVGETSAQAHDEIGGYAKSKGIGGLYTLGAMSGVAVRNFGEGGWHFGSPDALAAALAPRLDANTTVLVKGSRFMRMERVADALAAPPPDTPEMSD